MAAQGRIENSPSLLATCGSLKQIPGGLDGEVGPGALPFATPATPCDIAASLLSSTQPKQEDLMNAPLAGAFMSGNTA